MSLRTHANYQSLIEKAHRSHEQNRSPEGISAGDIQLARLYCYAFRLHTIGAFHATKLAIQQRPAAEPVVEAYRIRATESLADLCNQAMEPVPTDFRALISTLYRYHHGVTRVLDSLNQDYQYSSDQEVSSIGNHFRNSMQAITGECGIHLTQDTYAPEQASFVVPNLGIVIVPLVYGEHHSWNLAYLGGDEGNVPTHLHHHGVEIHLGYNPTHGETVLGDSRSQVGEGYAMPIPPETAHGWVNNSENVHLVPFIFGSMKHGGWGVFLDVEPQSTPVSDLRSVDRNSQAFSQMVYLEREIESAARMSSSWRKTLIPYSVTNRDGSGGLELSLTRINPGGYSFPSDDFRIVSVSRGRGIVNVEGVERTVEAHDHFGVPSGMKANLRQENDEPLVVLDALIKRIGRGS